jgi:hypothetical protein
MSSITIENGKIVLRDGKVGTEQACCCGGSRCSSTNPVADEIEPFYDPSTVSQYCGCICTSNRGVILGNCSPETQAACEAAGGVYECGIGDGLCYGWIDNPDCVPCEELPGNFWVAADLEIFGRLNARPCCGGQCCEDTFSEFLDRYLKPPFDLVWFGCCDGECYIDETPQVNIPPNPLSVTCPENPLP